ncbi:MAG: AMP-binding protein, partial [Bacteroidota bacterium]
GLSIRYMRSFNPTRLLDLICAKKIDHAALVPAMMQACQNTEHSPDLVRGLRTILYGASPITETLLRNASERYRCEFFQIYGMTETHSVITVLGASEHLRMLSSESSLNIGSAGRPVPGSSLQIVDEAGAPVEKCIAGEIRVSSQHTMTGYWNDASATNESIRDGFLYTGDVGYVNEEGFLYIIDRIKDLIISGGENVSSLEVESALIAHAAIDDVAVIGTHDDRWGECVTAVVVRADDELNEKDVVEFGKSWLAGFKAPKRVIFVDSIPRNANGKILKKNLREGCYKEDIR